jgi:replicative DNA helicase
MLHEPPHNLDAERWVIGACLNDNGALERVTNLQPGHFYGAAHREIFQAIVDVTESGAPADPVTISERLECSSPLQSVGGFAYLVEVTHNTPGAANVASYARIVVEKARERELLAAVADVQERVLAVGTADEKTDFAQARFMALTAQDAGGAKRIGDLRAEFLVTMEQRAAGEIVGTPTRFDDLDKMLGGLRPGNLVIVAARPSMGKSSFAFQIAQRNARNGRGALCFSMEMSAIEVHDRLIAWETGLPLGSITSGRPTTPGHIHAALQNMRDWPMEIDDSAGLTVREIRSRCRTMARRHRPAVVIVDYLQLMQGDGDTRNAQIESVTRGLKALAKELETPVIALSQLSRKCEERTDRRPVLSDLRESGAIEQDADVVVMIHREEAYRRDPGEWRGKAELLVRKNRQGPTGTVRMAWRASQAAFETFAGDWSEPADSVRLLRRGGGFDG